jgi:hypothetical protein
MKVNILPSILKGGGGRDKGGTEKEGGRTGRGDIQGGGTYREGGHTGMGDIQGWGTYREGGHTGRGGIQGGGTYMEGGHTWRGDIHGGGTYMEGGQGGGTYRQGGGTYRQWWMGGLCPWGLVVRGRPLFAGGVVVCPRALVIRGRGRRRPRGIVVVRGGGSSSSVGTAMPVLCRRGVVGVVWGVFAARCSWWGRRCLQRVVVDAWGVVVVHGIRGRSSSVGGRSPLCVRGVVVCPCVRGGSSSFVGAGSLFGGGHRGWREVVIVVCGVCVAVNVARPDGPSTCHVSSSVVAPFVGRHRRQRSSRSSFL